MTTNKPKLQGYVKQQYYDAIEEYKKRYDLTTGQALECAIAALIGLPQPQQTLIVTPDIEDRLEKLEVQLLELAQQFNAEKVTVSVKRKFASDTLKQSISDIPSADKPLSGRQLAQRLKNTSRTWLANHRDDCDFANQVELRDPENMAWQYDSDIDKYRPIQPLQY